MILSKNVYLYNKNIMGKIKYVSGELINGCVYVSDVDNTKDKARHALFICSEDGCNNIFESRISSIKNGNTKSCGCIKNKQWERFLITHGLSGNRLYKVWANIKTRCLNKGDKNYKNYGGRGIGICDEWANDFEAFYNYITTLKNYGEPGYTIDRIDNDGNYEPGNIRWATRSQQNLNQRQRKSVFGYIGVTLIGEKYRSGIMVGGIFFHLGCYDLIHDAINARNDFILENKLPNKTQLYNGA